jgi:hypothetical protein
MGRPGFGATVRTGCCGSEPESPRSKANSLFGDKPRRICPAMSARLTAALLIAGFALCASTSADAQSRPAPTRGGQASGSQAVGGPKLLGRFDDWAAATHEEGGQTVCYAFTRAAHSTPALPGRDKPVLTVTERPAGRDSVALSAGFAYASGAEVTVQVEQSALSFYTSGRSAFAREGGAAVAAFGRGRQAFARSPGPHGGQVVDIFPLRGFSQAYQAINKACPR